MYNITAMNINLDETEIFVSNICQDYFNVIYMLSFGKIHHNVEMVMPRSKINLQKIHQKFTQRAFCVMKKYSTAAIDDIKFLHPILRPVSTMILD